MATNNEDYSLLSDLIESLPTNEFIIALIVGLFSILGVFIGVFIGERNRRKLLFSEKYYEKKLTSYDTLYKMLYDAQNEWEEWLESINNTNKKVLNEKEFSEKYNTFFEIPEFLDRNWMYINETISIHIMFTLVGAKDCLEADEKDKIASQKEILADFGRIKKAIREDLGFVRLDKELKSFNEVDGGLKTMNEYLKELNKNVKDD